MKKRIRRVRAVGCARQATPETESRVPTSSEYIPGDADPLPKKGHRMRRFYLFVTLAMLMVVASSSASGASVLGCSCM